ncbi:MAG: TonB-dependent receptor [Prevotellaceae bacterium]|jgi:outer membrane receptor protein involved in Fe transport|nr:TonB-dependent receptor [Prevotellaceae bacterium]
MKKIVFIIQMFLCVNFVYAVNDGIINGIVIDFRSKEALELATVIIKKKNDSVVAPVGVNTDKNGRFSIKNIPYGDYILSISSIGYKTFEQEISLTPNTATINLRQISLTEESELLDEVQVTAIGTQMRIDIDKKVFNVDQNIAAAGGSASEVLSNIPSVEVNTEGEVSLRGNSAVTIWINGKASGLSADNRGQILEQMPAENIDRIEVITNPSAKYSPEGTAGIINIVLKENRRAGYFGSIQAGVNSRGGYNLGFNYNYSSRKLDAYASLNHRSRVFTGGSVSSRLMNGTNTFLNQVADMDGRNSNFFGRAGLTYHLTTADHFSLTGFNMFGKGSNDNITNYKSNIPDSYTQSERSTLSENNMLGGNVQLGYKHDFSKNSNIDFTASYNSWGMDDESVYTQTSLYPDSHQTSSYQRQTRDIGPYNWEFQLDYVNSFTENSKLEAGYKGTFGREDSPVETFSGTTQGDAVATPELFNRFFYNQDIHALYSTYTGRLNKFGYQLGLRGEYSNIETRSLRYLSPDPSESGEGWEEVPFHTNDYFDLFPSFFLSYALPSNNEMQVNYTRRITRPRGYHVNSFMNITDSTNISFGNPDLLPEYSNSFELNYIKSWQNHILSFSGYYRSTDNIIQRISYLDDNIMRSTFENVAGTSSAGTEFVLKNKFASFVDVTTTVNLFYKQLEGFSYVPEGVETPVTGIAQEDFSWDAKIIASFILPKLFSLQLTGDYRAKQLIAQGYRKANYSLDAGVRRMFGKISASINARDIFNSRKWHTVTSGTGFSQDSKNWRGGRFVGLTVTYNFGNMKPERQERKPDQENTENEYDAEF